MNQVNLAGYLAADPQIKDTAKGKFAVLTVVTNEYGKRDETTGEAKQYSEFHRVVCWDGRTAENLGRFARKGSFCIINGGSLTHRKYQDQQGADRYVTEVSIRNGRQIRFMDIPKRGNGADMGAGQDMNGGSDGYANGGMNGHHNANNGNGDNRQLDDDIPF